MPSDKVTNLLTFGHPRAGRRGRSESVPFIHEKWRRSKEILNSGTAGDLERLKKEHERYNLILGRIRLSVRGLQMICSLLIVALIAQSLVMFTATRQSFINATTKVWPDGIELWSDIVVLSLNVALMVFAFVLIAGYFRKYTLVKYYTTLTIISTISTMLVFIICVILLKSQTMSYLPLYKVSCLLADQTHRFDHKTVCQSNNWALGFCIVGIVLDVFLLCSILFIHWRSRVPTPMDTVVTKLKDFNFDIRTSLRIPSPTYRTKPNLYPGRLWRLEWGDMEDPFAPNGTLQTNSEGNSKVTYAVIGPGIAAAQSPTYRTYF